MPGHPARDEAAMNERSGLAIERVAETGSTNSDLLERVRALAASTPPTSEPAPFEPCVRVAERQRAGRGRYGRAWHATPGASLTFSIAWPFARGDLSGLSLAVGTALADSLDPAGKSGRIRLKWPNDLWLLDDDDASGAPQGRKLGGVLIETAPLGRPRGGRRIGLNVGARSRRRARDAAGGRDRAWRRPGALARVTAMDDAPTASSETVRAFLASFDARTAARRE